MKNSKIDVLCVVAKAMEVGDYDRARKSLQEGYPNKPIVKHSRSYTIKEMMEQFYRDGFIDRYSGERLINPGMLRIMSQIIPDVFPYHPHWKTDECHMAYWDYQPTVDHIIPIALGGENNQSNWATTSMINNSAKSNFTLEQLGWSLKDSGNIDEWDGLSNVFVNMVEQDQSLLKVKKIKEWYFATKSVL